MIRHINTASRSNLTSALDELVLVLVRMSIPMILLLLVSGSFLVMLSAFAVIGVLLLAASPTIRSACAALLTAAADATDWVLAKLTGCEPQIRRPTKLQTCLEARRSRTAEKSQAALSRSIRNKGQMLAALRVLCAFADEVPCNS